MKAERPPSRFRIEPERDQEQDHIPPALRQLQPHVSRTIATLERQIAAHPGIAVAVGVSVGIILGWMVKRR